MKTGLMNRLDYVSNCYCLVIGYPSKHFYYSCTDLGISSEVDRDMLMMFKHRVDNLLSVYNINRDDRYPFVSAAICVCRGKINRASWHGQGSLDKIPDIDPLLKPVLRVRINRYFKLYIGTAVEVE